MSFETELQKIYDREINVEISWFQDGRITIKPGDPLNGEVAQTQAETVAAIVLWLQRAIARHCPDSDYYRRLGSSAPPPLEIEGATTTLCAHLCPNCGEVNSFPGWSENVNARPQLLVAVADVKRFSAVVLIRHLFNRYVLASGVGGL